MEEKLPIFNSAQQTGSKGAANFESIMNKFCLVTEIAQQDIGIDFSCTILENSKPTVFNFNVQCKATEDEGIYISKDNTYFSYQIKTSTINYWKQKPDPTFLVLVDNQKRTIYWVDALNYIKDKDISNNDKVTFRIPKISYFDDSTSSIPKDFKMSILNYHANFAPRVLKSIDILQNSLTDIEKLPSNQIGDIITKLQDSLFLVNEETTKLLIDIMKQHFRSSMKYAEKLDQLDETVRKYCKNGIYHEKFSFGDKEYSVLELENIIIKIETKKNMKLDELKKMAINFETFCSHIVHFYREMSNEDNPWHPNPQVKVDIENFESERIFTERLNIFF